MIKVVHKDSNNEYNKLVYSQMSSFYKSDIHEGVSIKYVHNGKEEYNIDGKPFEVSRGEYLVVDHEAPFIIDFDSKEDVVGLCLYFDKNLLKQMNSNILSDNLNEVHVFQDKFNINENLTGRKIKNLFLNYNREVSSNSNSFYYDIAEALFLDNEKNESYINKLKAVKRETREEIYRRIRHSLEFINDNLSRHLLIPDIARNCGMSEFHYFRSFKTLFGITPQNYIMSKKIELAKQLILNPEYNVNIIAQKLSFTDSSHFSKSFKSIVGKSPNKYKKQIMGVK